MRGAERTEVGGPMLCGCGSPGLDALVRERSLASQSEMDRWGFNRLTPESSPFSLPSVPALSKNSKH